MILVVLAFFVQPVAVWFGEQTKFLSLMRHKQLFRSVHRRNGQMLVFFGIANIFLGLVALDTVNGNGDYTYALKISYGVLVGFTLMAYMLYQPKTATFQVHSQKDFLVPQLCIHLYLVLLQRGDTSYMEAFVSKHRTNVFSALELML